MASPVAKTDRQTTTPFHLKLFYRNGSFNRLDEFSLNSELPPHVQIYTWPSCTLRELSHLLTSALPSLLPDPAIGTRLSYRLIFPDTRTSGQVSGPGRYMTKDLGSVIIGEGGPGILPDEEEAAIVRGGQMAGRLGGEPEKTLQDARFVIGDYVCCAITPPPENGGAAPPPSGPSRSGYGPGRGEYGGRGGGMGPRENGFGGGFRGRGGPRGGGGFGQGFVPNGEWRRGEQVPDGPGGGRGRGFGGGFGGSRGGRW
ncbi:Sin3 associated polypeptide p18-domain-containing protein [Cadophora sp. MPI-SDFR-AT-0126]|nr:Sin3 associated polypeptide p18-domain-containing protein [Leotiomycetes sp. MPI-SDFR-AT-0126]